MNARWGFGLAAALLFLSCASVSPKANLTPDEKEFLSSARYLINKQERKTFLDLPPSERQSFIEDFWKKRDPNPETEANEFKDEYYHRLDTAKHIFTEGGTSGWLQDRGRVYILLGPPEQREQYPRGVTFYGPPVEIWHYGFHELYFVDSDWSGNFELRPQSVRMLSLINAAQVELRPRGEQERTPLSDFGLEVKKPTAGDLLLLISIPYQDIWLSSEGGKFETTLEISVEVFDSDQKKAWTESKAYPISVSREQWKDLRGQKFIIEIPVRLKPGKYRADVNLKNLTDQTQVKKDIKLIV